MFLISRKLITVLTFPGVIIHELGHRLACLLAGVHVYKTCYFRLGNPAGYVIHEPPVNYGATFLISVAPFLFNTVIAIIMFLIATNTSLYSGLFYWLGFSIGMHAFPSSGDASSLWQHSKSVWLRNPLALLGFPIIVLILLANILRVVWFDLFYAVGLLFLAHAQVATDLFTEW